MITILIPLFISARYIQRLIPTLFPLDTECEILLINDGSTDNTAAVCKKLAKKYHEIVLQAAHRRFVNAQYRTSRGKRKIYTISGY